MDYSWAMRMTANRSKSPDQPASGMDSSGNNGLSPEDFADVFGGPPRSVLSGHFASSSSSSSCDSLFYDEIFRFQENVSPSVDRVGRSLKQFVIPRKGVHSHSTCFYGDNLLWDRNDGVMRSRSRSKRSSSSVLSPEELSPLRADDAVSLFASKLRPINVQAMCNPTRMAQEDRHRLQNMAPSVRSQRVENFRNRSFGVGRLDISPEAIGVDPISFRVCADDLELNSSPSSSAVSSVCYQNTIDADDIPMNEEKEQEDEIMSSFVIEINSDSKEGTSESNGVDEAIAWAKEKFQTVKWANQECEEESQTEENLSGNQLSEGHTDSFGSQDEQSVKLPTDEEIQQFESKQMQAEMKIMDEKIRMWSNGKESDIRLLLSSLHHILWPNSGWYMIPLSNIIESSKVRKAYQKARLCLHPDKIQQRGSTPPQKYIAEKAFSILQDAWEAFISQDVLKIFP